MIVFSEKKDLIMAIKKLKKLNSSKKFINNGSKFNHCSGTTNLIKLFFIIQHAKELLQVATMGANPTSLAAWFACSPGTKSQNIVL